MGWKIKKKKARRYEFFLGKASFQISDSEFDDDLHEIDFTIIKDDLIQEVAIEFNWKTLLKLQRDVNHYVGTFETADE